MLQTVVAISVFTGIVVMLSALVLLVRRRLLPRHDVSIQLNRDRQIQVPAGEKLLWGLAASGILLPAACGGRGSCGQCRVRVTEGAPPLLPTEASHIGAGDAALGMRLACMVTVREPLAVELPPELLEAREWQCRVVSNRNLTPFLKEVVLALPEGEALDYDAGDYVLLEAPAGEVRYSDIEVAPAYADDWKRLQELSVRLPEPTRRAYSLASHPGEAGVLKLVVRIALPPPKAPADTPPGKVSSYIFSLGPKDRVTVSGPFGTFHARSTNREMVLIGGGAGIAPMRSMILDQLVNRGTTRRISFWYGARNLKELCFRDEFEALSREHDNFSYRVALSDPDPADAWSGPTGFIHTVVYEEYLKDHPAPEEAEYYLCGPPLMSSAVVAMLEDLGVYRDSILYDDFGA
jgi:Na+-transporting NADH:ubiquinone oxidoreductase subunit F